MVPKKKTPIEELSDQLVEIKVLESLPKASTSQGFDSAKFKELAQKVRDSIKSEDLLRLEASI